MLFNNESVKPTILAVDDSVENLVVLTTLLKEHYRIKVAKNGTKAIELAQQDPMPDLILLDVVMPDIDGFKVCEILKKDPKTQKIPIIFLTALNEVEDETKGLRLGGADFITKPINPDIVKARINIHLELQEERKKTETLLKVLLPSKVISDLMVQGHHPPEVHPNVSVMFCDFIGFTNISSQLTPEFLIGELTEMYGRFDDICEQHNATRIKTIGDAYMAATGLNASDDRHADNLVNAGLAFLDYLHERNTSSGQQWHCRIGVHSGSVIAGIIGKTRFAYDIMGMDVNIAARVEGSGRKMMVTVSDTTKGLLSGKFAISSIGSFALKGAGEKELFVVERSN